MKVKPDDAELSHENYLERLSLLLKRATDMVYGAVQPDDETPRNLSLIAIAFDHSTPKTEVRAAMSGDTLDGMSVEELLKMLEEFVVRGMKATDAPTRN